MTPPSPRHYTPPPTPSPVAVRRLLFVSCLLAFLAGATGLYEAHPWPAFSGVAVLALANLVAGAAWRWREAQRKVGQIFDEELS